MIFSRNPKFRKILSLALVLVLMTSLFTGCKKSEQPQDTTEPGLNLDLTQNNAAAPSETQTEPVETTEAPVINENTATVTSQLNIRSSPSTEATVVGSLYAGDKVEISRREEVTGIDWAYIISPSAGWIVMEFVEMDIPTEVLPLFGPGLLWGAIGGCLFLFAVLALLNLRSRFLGFLYSGIGCLIAGGICSLTLAAQSLITGLLRAEGDLPLDMVTPIISKLLSGFWGPGLCLVGAGILLLVAFTVLRVVRRKQA
jgi:hypothetical protein